MKKVCSLLVLLLTTFFLTGCNLDEYVSIYEPSFGYWSQDNDFVPNYSYNESPTSEELLTVHFIDVGQGDSVFIELPNNETMLIDAGDYEAGDKVVNYIFEQGYDSLDYLIVTHDHIDHTGGLFAVVNNFEIDCVYTSTPSDIGSDKLNDMIWENKILVQKVETGSVIVDEPSFSVEAVAPTVIDEENPNNNSIVLKLVYGTTTFVFTGDAEKQEEDSIRSNIKCDVLKIGHHGSNTSTSVNFLKKTEPTYAIISCGLNNKYGHPTDRILQRLYENNISVFRTDIQGTIICFSDGSEISFNKKSVVV